MFVFLPDTYFLFWDKLPSHKEARADTMVLSHMDVFIKVVYVQTQSQTHLLKLSCINTPTFIIT